MDLAELKKEYIVLQKKYKLPSFEELNENFEIDRIERETDTLLREIRKVMIERIVYYVKIMEFLIAPSNAPPIFMQFAKQVSTEEFADIRKLYGRFSQVELGALEMEIDYAESGEAKLVKEIFDLWIESKDSLRSIVAMMKRNLNLSNNKKERSYFG